jgi:hypothetical protein
MTNRLSIEQRRRIQESELSVRELAEEMGVSTSTVQRWKNRSFVEEKRRRGKARGGVSPFNDELFRELVKLSRYGYRRLCNYLKPIEHLLKDVQGGGEGEGGIQELNGTWGDRAYYHYLSQLDEGQWLIKEPKGEGVASHAIRVSWSDNNGKLHKAKILLILERDTGYIYARAFNERMPYPSFATHLKIFWKYILNEKDLKSLKFVTSLPYKSAISDQRVSTVLSLKNEQEETILVEEKEKIIRQFNLCSNLSFDSLTTLNENVYWIYEKKLSISFELDSPAPRQENTLYIPGRYGSIKDLNRTLLYLIGLVNMKNQLRRKRKALFPQKLLFGWEYRKISVRELKLSIKRIRSRRL